MSNRLNDTWALSIVILQLLHMMDGTHVMMDNLILKLGLILWLKHLNRVQIHLPFFDVQS